MEPVYTVSKTCLYLKQENIFSGGEKAIISYQKCKQATQRHFKHIAQPLLADWECLRVIIFVVTFGE